MKGIKKWILWSITLLWMMNILSFSSKTADISKQQSGFFVSIVQKMVSSIETKLKISIINTEKLDHFIRKTAHVFNYFVLTVLLIFAYLSIHRSISHSVYTALLFSILDEVFQTFVPGRAGMFRDIFIDQIGAGIAFLLFYWILRRRKLL
jgi:VanZ family protein